MQSLISTQMVEYPSFCFHADLVFQEKTSSLCECWILKSVNFSINCILPVHKNCTQFMNIFSTQCMHILSWLECDRIIFRVLTFCYCQPVFLRQ